MLNTNTRQISVNASKDQTLIIPAGAIVAAGVSLAGLEPTLKTLPATAAVTLVALQLRETLTFTVVVTGAVLAE